MKKQLLLAIILMVTAGTMLNAQQNKTRYFADTLHIYVVDDFRMMILSENISKYKPADTLNKLIKAFGDDLMNFEMPDLGNRFMQINYNIDESGNSTFKFKDVTDQEKTFVVLEDGETLLPMPIEIVLSQGSGTQLHLFMINMNFVDRLSEFDIPVLISEILAKQLEENHEIKRIAMTTVWKVEDGVIAEKHSTNYRNTPSGDQISLSGTVGASLIRNRLVPSFDFVVGISLASKTRIKHMINADLSMNYIFNELPEGGFSTDINTFIGASYFINTSRNPDKSTWYGVGVSYLVWQNGSFFDDNTWRITLGAKFGERFSVMPELYISDGFKKVMPGLKFKVWF